MASAQTEPSMDEILASIRRIISEEDDAPAEAPTRRKLETLRLHEAAEPEAPAAEVAAEPEPELAVAEAAPEPAADEPDALDDFAPMDEAPVSAEATMEPAAVAHDEGQTEDETFDAPPAPEEPMAARVASAVRPAVMAGLSVSETSATQAASAFGALEENVRLSAGSGRTIEDLVEAMLTPLLKAWLDENLPRIVEDKVEEEVRRIARRR